MKYPDHRVSQQEGFEDQFHRTVVAPTVARMVTGAIAGIEKTGGVEKQGEVKEAGASLWQVGRGTCSVGWLKALLRVTRSTPTHRWRVSRASPGRCSTRLICKPAPKYEELPTLVSVKVAYPYFCERSEQPW